MKDRCISCDKHMTWADQRVQYGRLRRRGLPDTQAKAAMPCCQKCVTRRLHNDDLAAALSRDVTRDPGFRS
jgi:hypothetical protein